MDLLLENISQTIAFQAIRKKREIWLVPLEPHEVLELALSLLVLELEGPERS